MESHHITECCLSNFRFHVPSRTPNHDCLLSLCRHRLWKHFDWSLRLWLNIYSTEGQDHGGLSSRAKSFVCWHSMIICNDDTTGLVTWRTDCGSFLSVPYGTLCPNQRNSFTVMLLFLCLRLIRNRRMVQWFHRIFIYVHIHLHVHVYIYMNDRN